MSSTRCCLASRSSRCVRCNAWQLTSITPETIFLMQSHRIASHHGVLIFCRLGVRDLALCTNGTDNLLKGKAREEMSPHVCIRTLASISNTLPASPLRHSSPRFALLRRRQCLGDFRRDDWCQPSPLLNVETRPRLHTPVALNFSEISITT